MEGLIPTPMRQLATVATDFRHESAESPIVSRDAENLSQLSRSPRVDAARTLLNHLSGMGVTISLVDCDSLDIKAPPATVTAPILAEIRSLKPELIGLLTPTVAVDDAPAPTVAAPEPEPEPDPEPPDYAAMLAPDFEVVAGPVDPEDDPFRGVTPEELASAVEQLGALNRALTGGKRR